MNRLLAISRGILLASGLLALSLFLQQCGGSQPFELKGSVQGYNYQVILLHPPEGADPAKELLAVEARISEVLQNMGGCDPAAVREVNQLAGERSGSMEQEAYDLVLECFAHRKSTGGRVEFLAGPLLKLYGFCDAEFGKSDTEGKLLYPELAELPTTATVDSVLQLVQQGGTYVVERGMLLSMKGMSIQLTDMLEGRVVDELYSFLRREGYSNMMIAFGSVTGVWGEGPTEQDWLIHLMDPRDPTSSLGTLRLQDGEILGQMGNGPRALRLPDGNLCYAVNPLTGLPVESPALAITVSRKAVQADVCASALFVGGEEFLPTLPAGVQGALWFSPEGDWTAPQGTGDLTGRFQPAR